MNIEIRKVIKENLNKALSLHVSESQKSYVESTKECLEDAIECKCYRPVGLYDNDTMVGFAMYGFFPNDGDKDDIVQTGEDGRVWLDRYLIDERFQGKGFGNIMLKKLITLLINIYNCNKIYLSVYEDNKRAIHLYKKFGFQFNGELDINGEKVMVKVI